MISAAMTGLTRLPFISYLTLANRLTSLKFKSIAIPYAHTVPIAAPTTFMEGIDVNTYVRIIFATIPISMFLTGRNCFSMPWSTAESVSIIARKKTPKLIIASIGAAAIAS